MATKPWPLTEAKARLSEVVEQALKSGPQVITRHGKRVGILISPDEWDRRTGAGQTLSEFLLNSPLRGANLEFKRSSEQPRRIKL